MASQLNICNLALTHLGQELIMSLDEDSKPAQRLKAVWPDLVDELLSEHDWTFARKRLALARLEAAPAWGFAYAYQLPGDYLKLPEPDRQAAAADNAWAQQEWRKEGRLLLSDEAEIKLLYIARVDAGQFSSKFAMALSYRLGAVLANDLTQNFDLSKGLYQMFTIILAEAKHQDSREAGKISRPSAWLNARN